MRLLVGLALVAATPAMAAEPANPGSVADARGRAACEMTGQVTPIARSPARVWKLTEPPPANMMLTVMRRIDGCPVPVIVRYGVDRQPQERLAPPAEAHRR